MVTVRISSWPLIMVVIIIVKAVVPAGCATSLMLEDLEY
jgi:hypothetical protein